jgi:hypothetical protein
MTRGRFKGLAAMACSNEGFIHANDLWDFGQQALKLDAHVQELEAALKGAIDSIASEYCSHRDPCGPKNELCYAADLYEILEKGVW